LKPIKNYIESFTDKVENKGKRILNQMEDPIHKLFNII